VSLQERIAESLWYFDHVIDWDTPRARKQREEYMGRAWHLQEVILGHLSEEDGFDVLCRLFDS
jgi:hypothetical protein